MSLEKIKPTDYMRTIQDYPEPGVNFYDINSLFAQPAWNQCAAELSVEIQRLFNRSGDLTHIVGIESRGFVVGAVLASCIGVPFIMVRKKGTKYPGSLLEESYALEYGEDTLVLQEGILGHANRVLIVDDLVATGGSMLATKRLVEQAQARVVGFASVINLAYLNTEDMKRQMLITLEEITK
jgi:adenine phosphoribosyltransferase|tara:strand:- start:156 stop:701 length:546 start_codon:yes stop_codon:yes gene_type:complete